jgi:protein TonB
MKHYPMSSGRALLAGAVAALLAACSAPPPAPVQAVAPPPPVVVAPPPVVARPAPAVKPPVAEPKHVSAAADPRAYRKDAASHLYGLHKTRIYKGRMPPLLYAVGVLQVEVDQVGQVQYIIWMRAPSHAPEVIKEIEGMVRAAAPFPAPARMGKVTYTDTWLWHKSGRFQLDTLTEGQD